MLTNLRLFLPGYFSNTRLLNVKNWFFSAISCQTLLILVASLLFVSSSGFGATSITGLNVSPSLAIAGQPITVSFTVTGTGTQTYFGVVMDQNPTFSCGGNTSAGNPEVWLLDATANFTTLTAGVYPDFSGPNSGNGGIVGPISGSSIKTYSLVVPPDAPPLVYVHVVEGDNFLQDQGSGFSINCHVTTFVDSPAIVIDGALPCPHLNLQIANPGGQTTTKYETAVKILNMGYWPVAADQLCVNWYFYNTTASAASDWTVDSIANQNSIFSSTGATIATIANTSTNIQSITTANCATSRDANLEATTCISDVNVYVPGGGGYLLTGTTGQVFGAWQSNDGATLSGTDYTRSTDSTSATDLIDSPYAVLSFQNNAMVEYTANNGFSNFTKDSNTGEEPCNITPSDCVNPTPTNTPTNTPSPTPTNTNTPTGAQATQTQIAETATAIPTLTAQATQTQIAETATAIPTLTAQATLTQIAETATAIPTLTEQATETQIAETATAIPTLTAQATLTQIAETATAIPTLTAQATLTQIAETATAIPTLTAQATLTQIAETATAIPTLTEQATETQIAETATAIPTLTAQATLTQFAETATAIPTLTEQATETQFAETATAIPTLTAQATLTQIAETATAIPTLTEQATETQIAETATAIPTLTAHATIRQIAETATAIPTLTEQATETQIAETATAIPTLTAQATLTQIAETATAIPTLTAQATLTQIAETATAIPT